MYDEVTQWLQCMGFISTPTIMFTNPVGSLNVQVGVKVMGIVLGWSVLSFLLWRDPAEWLSWDSLFSCLPHLLIFLYSSCGLIIGCCFCHCCCHFSLNQPTLGLSLSYKPYLSLLIWLFGIYRTACLANPLLGTIHSLPRAGFSGVVMLVL